MEPSNINHDAFFKSYFGRPETLSELVQVAYPARVTGLLDLTTIKIEPGSHVDSHLRQHYSDLVASVACPHGPAKIYILVEHKSYHEPTALLQILRYMLKVWEKDNTLPLTPILPLLFYHGKKAEVEGAFASLFGDSLLPQLVPYQPSFITQVFNLTTMEDPLELQASRRIIAAVMAMKNIHEEIELQMRQQGRMLKRLGKDFVKEPDFGIISTYLGQVEVEAQEKVERALEELAREEGEEVAMTVADYFKVKGREEGEALGLERGRQEGERIGMRKGHLELARRMKLRGMPPEEIASLTDLSLEEIEKL